MAGCRLKLSDGVDDEDVYFGFAGNRVRHRAQETAGDSAHPQVADNEQVRFDLLGQMKQRGDRCADDRLLFDVMRTGGLRSFAGVLKNRIYGRAPVHPVTLARPEAVGGSAVNQTIGGGRP